MGAVGTERALCEIQGLRTLDAEECATACTEVPNLRDFTTKVWKHTTGCFAVVSGAHKGGCHYGQGNGTKWSDHARPLCGRNYAVGTERARCEIQGQGLRPLGAKECQIACTKLPNLRGFTTKEWKH